MSQNASRLKTGKSALDIFSPTIIASAPVVSSVAAPAAEPAPSPEPRAALEDWSKVTVVLLNRQVVFLDRLAATIREQTGATVKRAEILRALVDALAQSGLDLSSATSESAIKSAVLARMEPTID